MFGSPFHAVVADFDVGGTAGTGWHPAGAYGRPQKTQILPALPPSCELRIRLRERRGRSAGFRR